MDIESSATTDEYEFGSGLVIDFSVKVNRNLPTRLAEAISEVVGAIEASSPVNDDFQEISSVIPVTKGTLSTTTVITARKSFIGKLENRLWENESDLGRKIRLVLTFIGFIMSCIIFMCACICIYRKEHFELYNSIK